MCLLRLSFWFAVKAQMSQTKIWFSWMALKCEFKDFWHTKINLTQILCDEYNQNAFKVKNSLYTWHELGSKC